VAVVGPTASGKSRLGLGLAERLGLPIYVCDSVKVYRRLDIGSAKPGPEARARVRHELIDLVDPDVPFSAGDYARRALDCLSDGPGIFVGGSGLYLRAVAWTHTGAENANVGVSLDDPGRQAFEDGWRAREQREPGAIHRALAALDPETAAAIHPNNVVRCVRALWLCSALGEPVSAVRRRDPPRRRLALMLVVLDPGSDAVERAIERRARSMLEAGWLAEVEKLVEDGYDGRYKAMRSVGYRQLLDVVDGRLDLDEALEAITRATCQVARRQRTYFRHQLDADMTIRTHSASACPWQDVVSFVRGGRA
jgi:tRNA dimethylallyltransferase